MPVEEGVALLKELGYPGIGSVYPQDLAKYQAACEKNGLKVFSIYCTVKVHKTGFTYDAKIPAAIASLKGTDAIVELNIHRGDDPQEVHVLNLVKQIAADAKADCDKQAAEKKLAGAAKTSFVKKCVNDAKSPAEQACDKQAAEKKLAGAAKTSFTKKCVADAK